MTRINKNGLQVAAEYVDFIENEALPGSGVTADAFWAGLSALVHDFGPENRALLQKREDIQSKIDAWHMSNKGQAFDFDAYKAFLEEIGYLLPEGDDFQIDTANVDPEIAWVPVETDGGGDIDVTATGGIDADGTPTAAMDEAADLLTLISVPSNSGSDYRWAQIGNVGAVVIS